MAALSKAVLGLIKLFYYFSLAWERQERRQAQKQGAEGGVINKIHNGSFLRGVRDGTLGCTPGSLLMMG